MGGQGGTGWLKPRSSRQQARGGVRSRLLFFECISQPMEHVGKRCQIKKVPFPFLAWLAVKLSTQRAFF